MIKELGAVMSLFEGYNKAYGVYVIEGEAVPGEKKQGKAKTLRQAVTPKLWESHLMGYAGLGIIPINEMSNVKFGAIDIDIYDLDHKKLIRDVEAHKMPLVVCRTKSGGAHCYVFLTEWAPAKMVQGKLREMASVLGYGTSEIYPRQTEILAERGDQGQWINMPYYDHMKTNRYAFDVIGKMMTIAMFVTFAESRRQEPKDLAKWSTKVEDGLKDGPPCLNVLCKQGFPEGTRNNGLMNLGVYAMKSSPDGWEKLVVDLNNQFMRPPLPPSEVMGVIKSLKKKEYNYTCSQQPIQSHCNAVKCRMCKFGVGTGTGLPAMGTLTKLDTKPPTWFIDIEGGGRLELTTEALQNPRMFQLVCMETLNMVPSIPNKQTWDALIQKLMEGVSIVEVSEDMNPVGQFLEQLERFCAGRVQARTQDEILLGKPWLNGERHYFRISDLIAFLERNRFKHEGTKWIFKILRDHGGRHDFFVIKMGESKKKGVNVWSVPEFTYRTDKYPLPKQENEEPFA
jgi:hypothetical protein